MTGVYWTRPQTEPPGGTFKTEVLQGFTIAPQDEIDAVVRQASEEFQGTAYNLLTRNCNHFTSYICQKLTGRPGPGWLNRAASIGVALPCVVPREWIEPPEYQDASGELVEDDEMVDERSAMLRRNASSHMHISTIRSDGWDSDEDRRRGGSGKGKGKGIVRDSLRRKASSTSSPRRS